MLYESLSPTGGPVTVTLMPVLLFRDSQMPTNTSYQPTTRPHHLRFPRPDSLRCVSSIEVLFTGCTHWRNSYVGVRKHAAGNWSTAKEQFLSQTRCRPTTSTPLSDCPFPRFRRHHTLLKTTRLGEYVSRGYVNRPQVTTK